MTAEPQGREDADGTLVATFLLGQGVFGIDSALIEEVVPTGDLRRVHHAPGYVAGIRNLRGRIVTVVDLGVRLGLEPADRGLESRILIVDWRAEPLGLLVDCVADTVCVDPAALESAPPNVNGVQARRLRGVCRSGERLVALLHPAAVLEPEARGVEGEG